MEEKKKVILAGIIFVLLVALAIILYYFFVMERGDRQPSVEKISEQAQPEASEGIDTVPEEEMVEPLQVDLGESDALIRDLIKGVSSNPTLANWALTHDLILKFVAAVDSIANGQSPRAQVDFFAPAEVFKVTEMNGRVYVDPASYDRYNAVADVFDSLDTKSTVRLYKQLKLVIQEAYKELGYPDADFQDTLKRAIAELRNVPVAKDILLEKKIISYAMLDPQLENLSPAQKHLLRMGPENVLKIQTKLREMAQALGFRSD
jgi:hypothetical protein